jgi:hypothetical protein
MPNSSPICALARLATVAVAVAGAAILPAALVACGSGNTAPVDTIFATPILTGYVVGGSQQGTRTNDDIAVGDADANVPNSSLRGAMSFDLTQLPAGATVTSATLFTRECAVVGHPVPALGNVVLEHVNFGPVLDTAVYSTPAIDTLGGVLTSDSTIGHRTRNVTAAVLADIVAGRTTTQFLLVMSEFADSHDSANDYVVFQAPSGSYNTLCNPATRQGAQLLISAHM